MGFRYHKRVSFGNGSGLNISKSGLSLSQRTKFGTLGTKGFSIRTGIPGLSFRSGWAGKNSNSLISLILLTLVIGSFLIVVVYNVLRFLFWLINTIYHFTLRKHYEKKIDNASDEIDNNQSEENFDDAYKEAFNTLK